MRSLLAPHEPLAPGLLWGPQQRNGGRAGGTHRPGASDGNFPGPAPGRGAGANPRETDTSDFWGRKLLRAARPVPDLGESVPLTAGTGPAATRTAKRGSAPRGTARPGPGPVPGRPSARPAVSLGAGGGKGRGAPPPGRKNDPRLPARPPGAAERGAALTCGGAGAG